MSDDPTFTEAYQRLSTALQPRSNPAEIVEVVRSRRRKRRILLVLVSTATVTIVGGAALVLAGTYVNTRLADNVTTAPAGEGPTMSDQDWQARHADYKAQLVGAAARFPNFSGFRYEAGTLTLYGTGSPADSVTQLLQQAPVGVDAEWVSVPFSKEQLQYAVDAVMDSLPGVVDATYSDDFSGIVVGVDSHALSDHEGLKESARAVTDVPVTFVPSRGVSLRLFGE